MRDLDAELAVENPPTTAEQRSFQWMGVTITHLGDVPIGLFREIENRKGGNDMEALVSAIRLALDPSCYGEYDRVTSDPRLGVRSITKLWEALLEETVARPTQAPADSSAGSAQNGTPSTPGPSTTEEWTSGGLVPGASPTSPTPS